MHQLRAMAHNAPIAVIAICFTKSIAGGMILETIRLNMSLK